MAPIQPFADIGKGAYDLGRANTLQGYRSPAMTQAIASAAHGSVADSPISPQSQAVQRALAKEANLTGKSYDPIARQQLLNFGMQVGGGGARDIAGILGRGRERIGDITRSETAQRAAAMLGQVPDMAQNMQAGQEARLLGQAGTNYAIAGLGENLGRAAGRFMPDFKGTQGTLGLPSGRQSKI